MVLGLLLPSCPYTFDGFTSAIGQLGSCGTGVSQPAFRLHPAHLQFSYRQARSFRLFPKAEAVAERSSAVSLPTSAQDWPSVPALQQEPAKSAPASSPERESSQRAGRTQKGSEPKRENRGRPRKSSTHEGPKLFSTPEPGAKLPRSSSPAVSREDPQKRRRRRARSSRSPDTQIREAQLDPKASQPDSQTQDRPPSQASPQSQPSQRRRQQYQSRTPDRPVSAVKRQRSRSPPPAPHVADAARAPGQLTPEIERVLCLAVKVIFLLPSSGKTVPAWSSIPDACEVLSKTCKWICVRVEM